MRVSGRNRSRLACCIAGLLASTALPQEPNLLSPAEIRAGYDLLFNGSDLENWHAYRKTEGSSSWSVKTDGPLGPRMEKGSGDKLSLLTDRTYKNFDLKVDVQVPMQGEGGIFTRYEEAAPSVADRVSGPELQVCGPNHVDCGTALNGFGACYDMFAVQEPLRKTWHNQPGTWNEIRIIAFDSNYVHYGNGRKLLEYKIGTPEFLRAYDKSRYTADGNNGRYYDIHPGGIMFHHHGEIGDSYRNVKAKELDVHPFLREFPDRAWPDSLPHGFVFGGPSTALVPPGGRPSRDFSSRRGGPGEVLVEFPARPSDLRVAGLNGRAAFVRDLGGGRYAIRGKGGGPEVICLRFKIGLEARSGILVLP